MRSQSALTAIIVGVGIFAFTIGVRMLAGIDARVAYEQKVDLDLDAATTAVTSSLDRSFDALRNIDVAISHAAAVDISTTEAFHSYVSGTKRRNRDTHLAYCI